MPIRALALSAIILFSAGAAQAALAPNYQRANELTAIITAVAEAVPTDAGDDVVHAVRASIWGAPDEDLAGLPLGVAFAALVLTGCAPQLSPVSTPVASFPDGTTKTPRSTPTDGLDDGPSAPTPPAADSTSQAAAVKLAEKFMAAFARPQLDATTWIALATGALTWQEGIADGRVVASGERADLSPWLPLLRPPIR